MQMLDSKGGSGGGSGDGNSYNQDSGANSAPSGRGQSQPATQTPADDSGIYDDDIPF
jgi:single-stranded DNA-binding protein